MSVAFKSSGIALAELCSAVEALEGFLQEGATLVESTLAFSDERAQALATEVLGMVTDYQTAGRQQLELFLDFEQGSLLIVWADRAGVCLRFAHQVGRVDTLVRECRRFLREQLGTETETKTEIKTETVVEAIPIQNLASEREVHSAIPAEGGQVPPVADVAEPDLPEPDDAWERYGPALHHIASKVMPRPHVSRLVRRIIEEQGLTDPPLNSQLKHLTQWVLAEVPDRRKREVMEVEAAEALKACTDS